VYLAQQPAPDAETRARAIAVRMGLAFELRTTGYGTLETRLREAVVQADARRGETALPWPR
jgi:predicted ATPase